MIFSMKPATPMRSVEKKFSAPAEHTTRVGGIMVRVRSAVAILVAAALVFAACSSDKKTATTGGSASSSANAPLTASFRGVTATTIKIGIATVEFVDCATPILQFTHSTQGDAKKIMQALVDDINKNGGVDGRQLEVVFKALCPLAPADVAAACTSFTDDEQVFAVLGVYDTEPGDGTNQLCISKDHDTVQINELAFQKATMDQAPPGLLVMPGILPERRLDALFALLKQKHALAGKKVAVLADQDTAENADKVAKAAATSIGIQTGSTATLTITGTDTTAAQTQLDSFIEKWKSEGVNAVDVRLARLGAAVRRQDQGRDSIHPVDHG